MSVSIHELQIAREVKIYEDKVTATFFFGDSPEMLCVALYAFPNFRTISIANGWLGVEKASAVSIAIGMAIEWLSEQS